MAQIIDIDYRSKNPIAKKLSNLYPHAFTFQGIQCGSMEGFLQSLKRKDVPIQEHICSKAAFDAKFSAKGIVWQDTGLWWKGVQLDRFSSDYIDLLFSAYEALYDQNQNFKDALISSYPAVLDHTIGRTQQKETILTKKEFCGILTHLRIEGVNKTHNFEYE